MENFESIDQSQGGDESKNDGLGFGCEVCMDQGCSQCGFGRDKGQAA